MPHSHDGGLRLTGVSTHRREIGGFVIHNDDRMLHTRLAPHWLRFLRFEKVRVRRRRLGDR